MKKKGRYLIKEVQSGQDGKPIPLVSPSIREWECLETASSYFKVQDLVEYKVPNLGPFGPEPPRIMPIHKPFWVPFVDMLNKYEILEELD